MQTTRTFEEGEEIVTRTVRSARLETISDSRKERPLLQIGDQVCFPTFAQLRALKMLLDAPEIATLIGGQQ